MNRAGVWGAVCGGLLLAASCVMVMDPDRPPNRLPQAEYREAFELAPGGAVSIEIGRGDIEIIGGPEDVLEVVARGPAVFPAEGRGIRVYGTWNHRPDIDVRRTATGYRIRSRSLDGPGRPSPVVLSIRVPHSVLLEDVRAEDGSVAVSDVYGRLAVSLGRGAVTVKNFSGPADIAVGAGPVDAEVLDVRDGDRIAVTTGEGDIVLRLEPGTGARVEARAADGAVRSDFPLGVELPAAEISGKMGAGGAEIVLETRGGNIDIVIVKEVMKNHG